MRLLREFTAPHDCETALLENKTTGERSVIVRGPFAVAEAKNKNGRVYPAEILERECYKLNKMIAENKLTGELDHPEKPDVLLQNAAIKITSLSRSGNNFLGEARIMKETPKGAIAYALAKEGITFGTSTRGLGSTEIRESTTYVKADFNWLTNDLVADPSAPGAWVESIMEKAAYFIEEGYIKENVHQTYLNKIHNLSKEEGASFDAKVLALFESFIKQI